MKTCGRLAIGVTAVALACGPASAEHLRKVWEFTAGDAALGVFALSFSPDGQRIAAVAGRSLHEEFILVVDAAHPQAGSKKLEINPAIWGGDGSNWSGLSWSPSGRQILAGSKLLDLSSGHACSLPEPASVFVAPAHLAAREFKPTRLSFFDSDCYRTGEMDLGQDWSLVDASAERGIFCVQERIHSGAVIREVVVSIADAATETVLRRLHLSSNQMSFADHGKAICAVIGPNWHRTVECMDTDTGRKLAATKGWNAPDVRTAAQARVATISDYGRKLDWIEVRWYRGSLKKRVIWDFGTGRQLASWQPKGQRLNGGNSRSINGRVEPYRFALSPDGKYVVEGGAGLLTLFGIEP